jgi:hypothetical protein
MEEQAMSEMTMAGGAPAHAEQRARLSEPARERVQRLWEPSTVVSDPSLEPVERPWPPPPDLAPAGEGRFSIRMPTAPGVFPCAICNRFVAARGPTAYLNDQVVCDVCLLERESHLGMLIALASITRLYASFDENDGTAANVAAAQLLAFARIFELFARRCGPGRELDFEIAFVKG